MQMTEFGAKVKETESLPSSCEYLVDVYDLDVEDSTKLMWSQSCEV